MKDNQKLIPKALVASVLLTNLLLAGCTIPLQPERCTLDARYDTGSTAGATLASNPATSDISTVAALA